MAMILRLTEPLSGHWVSVIETYQPLAIFRESNDRRGGSPALGIWNDDRVSTLHDRDNGVGGTKVDPDDFAHPLSMKCE